MPDHPRAHALPGDPRRLLARAAQLAALAALCAGLTSCKCTEMACHSGVSIHGPMHAPEKLPATLAVTACRNDTCGQATMTAAWAPGVGTQAQAEVDLGEGVFRLSTDGAWSVRAYFIAGDVEMENGDRYRLRIVDTASQRSLVDVDRVVDYHEEQPNGSWCEPTCDAAEIEVSLAH